jgi:hypothetical protein
LIHAKPQQIATNDGTSSSQTESAVRTEKTNTEEALIHAKPQQIATNDAHLLLIVHKRYF